MQGKRKRGAPTLYKPEYCEAIIAYFQKAAKARPRKLAAVETAQTDKKGGYQKREVRRICAELPTIQGFAISIGVASQTLNEWTSKHPEFADAYARAKDIQFQVLVDRGLTRQYDPTAFTFVAKNITNMTDKQVLAGEAGGAAIQLVVMPAGSRPPE